MKSTLELVPAALRRFVGMRPALDDKYARAAQMTFTMSTECLAPPQSPFGKMARNGLLLHEQTHAYLYRGDYGFTEQPYRHGWQPLLEHYIASVAPEGSPAERVISLSQSFDDVLVKKQPKVVYSLSGEPDEVTLLKGGGHCSCRARLLTALCQIIGVQARPVMMWMWFDRSTDPMRERSGHTVVEVFIDGRWGFFDPQHHLYAQLPDGSFSSVEQIRQDPGRYFYSMSPGLVESMRPSGYGGGHRGEALLRDYWERNFDPRCVTQISRHDVNAPYEGWCNQLEPEFRRRQAADFARNKAILLDLAAKGQITDEVYAMGLEEFRGRMGITDGVIKSLWHAGPVRTPGASYDLDTAELATAGMRTV